jgi:hypothetical protein
MLFYILKSYKRDKDAKYLQIAESSVAVILILLNSYSHLKTIKYFSDRQFVSHIQNTASRFRLIFNHILEKILHDFSEILFFLKNALLKQDYENINETLKQCFSKNY